MKIWIDGYEANVSQRLGSSQVAFGLLNNLEKIDKKNEYTILLPRQPMEDLPKSRVGWQYKILKPSKLWTRIALPLSLYTARHKPDLIFSPTHYIPRFSPVKRIVTIFDLSYLHFPEYFTKRDLWQLTHWSKFSIERADHIITISNFSKSDIAKHYGVNKRKITVAYPAGNCAVFHYIDDKFEVMKMASKYGIHGRYIIFVGTIQPRKNLVRLIEAFKNIDNLKLVIVGKTTDLGRQSWMFEEILEKPRQMGIEDRVIFTGFVPDDELAYLMNGAAAYILPSLWEGFGIPVVDAMTCGVPVIVSNVSSLPEVVGKAGLLINPYSVDQIEQAIRAIASDRKLRAQKSKEALERSKKFTWQQMAKTVLGVFEEVAKS